VCFASLGACHSPPRRKSTCEFRGIGDAERRRDLRTNRSTRWLHDLPNLIRLQPRQVNETFAGASERAGILDATAQRPRNRASTFRATSVNAGIACRQPADRGPVELVASLCEQGYEPIVKEACER
jgi:hypothetical protein